MKEYLKIIDEIIALVGLHLIPKLLIYIKARLT